MKEYIITPKDEGMTLIKYVNKRLPGAGNGLVRKQLRGKNITLNSKKTDGSDRLKDGDKIQVFFSDETIKKFESTVDASDKINYATGNVDVLFENDDIIALNKRPGILTQKSKPSDISLNEEMISYLINSKSLTKEDLKTVTPSVCNRLDRNTSGIVMCGKTIKGLQWLSDVLKDRSAHKYYRCIVLGNVSCGKKYEAYLTKASTHNQVKITKEKISNDSQYIVTKYDPVCHYELSIPGEKSNKTISLTMLNVLLITGRSHQIRAHLSSLGYPIVGDSKYGDISFNKRLSRIVKIDRQLLHAYRIELPTNEITDNKELVIECPLPQDMTAFDRFRR